MSFFFEVCFLDWQVILYGVIDAGGSMVSSVFYQFDEVWAMHEIFTVLNACGSQVDFFSGGGFMFSAHALCISGANLRCGVDVLEIILESITHILRLGRLDELR